MFSIRAVDASSSFVVMLIALCSSSHTLRRLVPHPLFLHGRLPNSQFPLNPSLNHSLPRRCTACVCSD
jgi:hypothetical protein